MIKHIVSVFSFHWHERIYPSGSSWDIAHNNSTLHENCWLIQSCYWRQLIPFVTSNQTCWAQLVNYSTLWKSSHHQTLEYICNLNYLKGAWSDQDLLKVPNAAITTVKKLFINVPLKESLFVTSLIATYEDHSSSLHWLLTSLLTFFAFIVISTHLIQTLVSKVTLINKPQHHQTYTKPLLAELDLTVVL